MTADLWYHHTEMNTQVHTTAVLADIHACPTPTTPTPHVCFLPFQGPPPLLRHPDPRRPSPLPVRDWWEVLSLLLWCWRLELEGCSCGTAGACAHAGVCGCMRVVWRDCSPRCVWRKYWALTAACVAVTGYPPCPRPKPHPHLVFQWEKCKVCAVLAFGAGGAFVWYRRRMHAHRSYMHLKCI